MVDSKNYFTIEDLEKDFKIVAYGTMGIPLRFCEMHLVKNEDLSKTKPIQINGTLRTFKKVLPIKTKGVPSFKCLVKAANDYKLHHSHSINKSIEKLKQLL